jgi:hypothetical protein
MAGTEVEMSDSEDLRDTISTVMDGGEVEYVESDTDDTGDGKTTVVEDEGAAQAPEHDDTPGEGRVRDSLGRFVPKAKVGSDVAPPAGQAPGPGSPATQPGAAPGEATPTPAPQSWSPAAREHWAQMPAQVQQEVYRREQEMQRFVNDTAGARQVAERFYQTVQPFLPTIQAEGVDALTAVGNLMQFATRMRMGTPNEKATTIAALVKAYGVDVNALDSALVGQPLPQDGNPQANVQAAVQQALQPIYQAAQQRQQRIQQEAAWGAQSEMSQFAQEPNHEFFGDLRSMMADLIEVAERQGHELSLEDAYWRAAMLHPEVSRVIMARQQGVNAQQLTAAARRAKSAAVSVRGSAPVGSPNGAEPSSIRESIEAAIESHSRY